jgi:hypothetical protein
MFEENCLSGGGAGGQGERRKQDAVLHPCRTLCEWREGNLVGVGVEGQILTHPQGLSTIRDKLIRRVMKWLYRTQPPEFSTCNQPLEKFTANLCHKHLL